MVPATSPEQTSERSDGPGALEHASVLMPWAISITFHVGVLLIITLLIWAPVMRAPADEGLIVPMSALKPTDQPGAKAPGKALDPSKGPTERPLIKPADDVMDRTPGPINPNTVLAVLGESNPTGGGGANGLEFGSGDGCVFVGISGNARRIVYVVDRSGSMAGAFPYVREELKRSIGKLTPRQSFHVIFFADGTPFELKVDGRIGLQPATEYYRRPTVPWIDGMIAESPLGLTNPSRSLERAFRVAGGPPDLIYLLTDGMFPTEVIAQIDRLNPQRQVHINTIMFKDRSPEAEALLKKIAHDNGGTYRFISEEQLGSDY